MKLVEFSDTVVLQNGRSDLSTRSHLKIVKKPNRT